MLDLFPNVESTQFDVVSLTELFKEGEIYVAGSDNKTFNFVSGKTGLAVLLVLVETNVHFQLLKAQN